MMAVWVNRSKWLDGEDDEPKVVPDVAGYVEGFRFFRVESGRLCSQNAGGYRGRGWRWDKGVNEALCFADPNSFTHHAMKNGPDGLIEVTINKHGRIPEPTCGCGFWFYPNPPGRDDDQRWDGVMAKVKGWGRVIEGTSGWRSEFAEVVELYATSESQVQQLEEVAAYYGVPIVKPEKQRYVGVLHSISDPEPAMTPGRWRPLTVVIGDREFKVWPSTRIQGTLAGLVGKKISVQYQVQRNPGYEPSVFIESVNMNISLVLNGFCHQDPKQRLRKMGKEMPGWRFCPQCQRQFFEREDGLTVERLPLPAWSAGNKWAGQRPVRLISKSGEAINPVAYVLNANEWVQPPDAEYAEFEY